MWILTRSSIRRLAVGFDNARDAGAGRSTVQPADPIYNFRNDCVHGRGARVEPLREIASAAAILRSTKRAADFVGEVNAE
jgi:hypothetical protein